jgi:hypothetical protein
MTIEKWTRRAMEVAARLPPLGDRDRRPRRPGLRRPDAPDRVDGRSAEVGRASTTRRYPRGVTTGREPMNRNSGAAAIRR